MFLLRSILWHSDIYLQYFNSWRSHTVHFCVGLECSSWSTEQSSDLWPLMFVSVPNVDHYHCYSSEDTCSDRQVAFSHICFYKDSDVESYRTPVALRSTGGSKRSDGVCLIKTAKCCHLLAIVENYNEKNDVCKTFKKLFEDGSPLMTFY